VFDVVNFGHQGVRGHGDDGTGLDPYAIVAFGGIPERREAEDVLVVQGDVVGLLGFTVGE
jgi:hypothetical protein